MLHTFILSGSVILSDKGGNGYAESAGNHPIYSVNFAKGSIGSHGAGAQTVKRRLDNHVGSIVHHRLKPGGESTESVEFPDGKDP